MRAAFQFAAAIVASNSNKAEAPERLASVEFGLGPVDPQLYETIDDLATALVVRFTEELDRALGSLTSSLVDVRNARPFTPPVVKPEKLELELSLSDKLVEGLAILAERKS